MNLWRVPSCYKRFHFTGDLVVQDGIFLEIIVDFTALKQYNQKR